MARTRHLEYLGAENGVEAYRDERTGQKLYTGRTQPTLSPEQVARVAKLRDEANALLSPLLSKVIARKALGFFEKRTVKKAAALFHSVLEVVPEEWATRWTLGMIARAETEHSVALEHFRRAYRANPTQRDVGREYAGQCFINGEAAEGVQMSRELHARFPNDVGLHSNLALALLIGGDLDEAVATAHAAQARDPSDPVTKNLVDYTAKVKMGHIARPTKMPGG